MRQARAAQEAATRRRAKALKRQMDLLRSLRAASPAQPTVPIPKTSVSFTELAVKLTEGREDQRTWIALGVAVDLLRIFR